MFKSLDPPVKDWPEQVFKLFFLHFLCFFFSARYNVEIVGGMGPTVGKVT